MADCMAEASLPAWQEPGGLERVAAYPRPPALVPDPRPVRVEAGGHLLAASDHSLRVLETFHPPCFYLPPNSFNLNLLVPAPARSYCEWKGVARYFDVLLPDGHRLPRAVWQYPEPTPAFAPLAGWFSLYPAAMSGCWVDGQPVRAQAGGFYGGWITAGLIGPFKGDPAHPELI
jgi:uncharacterized protein (DUF427 family)